MDALFVPHIPPPSHRAGPAPGLAQAELRAMLAEMKAQRLEEQVAALQPHVANLEDELHAKANLLSLFSFGSHWDDASLPATDTTDYRLDDIPEVSASEDFPDLSMLEFSAAVQRIILDVSEQADPPSLPSSDESNAVVNAKKPNNRRRRQQQRNGRGHDANEGPNRFVDDKVLERREKQLEKAKEHAVYQRYAAEVPRSERKPGDPQTPNKTHSYSRRDFDNRVKNWKKSLHRWEERFEEEAALVEGASTEAPFKGFEDFDLVPYYM